MNGLRDYLTCAFANRVTLCLYTLYAIVIGCMLWRVGDGRLRWLTVAIIGSGLLCGSLPAMRTFAVYRRVRKHIRRHGRLHERTRSVFAGTYCTRVGLELAIRDCERLTR